MLTKFYFIIYLFYKYVFNAVTDCSESPSIILTGIKDILNHNEIKTQLAGVFQDSFSNDCICHCKSFSIFTSYMWDNQILLYFSLTLYFIPIQYTAIPEYSPAKKGQMANMLQLIAT